MSYYDVRIGMDDKKWTPIVGSVNLMCALLKDLTYSKLYEEPFWISGDRNCALEILKSNALGLHQDLKKNADGQTYQTDALLHRLFDDISTELAKPSVSSVRLKHLFLRDVAANSPDPKIDAENVALLFIYRTLENFFATHQDNMNHFCTPFMYMQQSKSFISETDWGHFIYNCGGHTLRQLFSLDRRSCKGGAVAEARKKFILKDRSKTVPFTVADDTNKQGTVHLLTPNGGNSRICSNGNSCVSSAPDNWCNLTEGGVCSAMSDP